MKPKTTSNNETTWSRWPHRVAMLMALVTFPLIWVGGLVTTYDAGMAVPDWPNTYGYNLFAYPIGTWIHGPWDLFIEHGHRLLGSLAGLLSIVFVVVVWRCDERKWLRWFAVVALLWVIAQGLLGGIRVLAIDRQVALIHGCVGPGFFAYCALLAAVTSNRWREASERRRRILDSRMLAPLASKMTMLGGLTFTLSYFQLFLGANLRHIAVDARPASYRMLVMLHLIVAVSVVVSVFVWWLSLRRFDRNERHSIHKSEVSIAKSLNLRRTSHLLLTLALCQILLGCGTWLVKFGFPSPFSDWPMFASYLPVAKSMLQANVITGHVAMGSLILAVSAHLSTRCLRLLPNPQDWHLPSRTAVGVSS